MDLHAFPWYVLCMRDTRKGMSFVNWHVRNREKLLASTTDAERAFARYLARLGVRFTEQQGFYTPCYRIADFYLPEQNLIIEIDGGYHKATTAKDRLKDAAFLEARGIRTLRLTNDQVLSGRIPTLS